MDQQQSETPNYQPSPEEMTSTVAPTKNKRRLLALWLLIGPTALIIGSLILYAIVNFILGSVAPETGAIEDSSLIQSILNVILFLVGAISVATWLPGIIIGIVLLTTQKKA